MDLNLKEKVFIVTGGAKGIGAVLTALQGYVSDRTGSINLSLETDETFDPEAKAAADAANPRVEEWERLMDTYQRRLSCAAPGQKWVPMELIFSLTPSASMETE